MKIVKIKSRFVSHPTPDEKNRGWENNTFYDIKIKQDGEKFYVKKADDDSKPSVSLLVLANLDEFVDKFTVHYRYIT